MGKDFQKSALRTLFKFARIRTLHQPHMRVMEYLNVDTYLGLDEVWTGFGMHSASSPKREIGE